MPVTLDLFDTQLGPLEEVQRQRSQENPEVVRDTKKKYRVGVASLVHDHVWGELKHWLELPNVEIVAAGDVNADLRKKFKDTYEATRVYSGWPGMLDKESL